MGHGIFSFPLLSSNLREFLNIFIHSQAGPLPLLEWKGEAETNPDAHVSIVGVAQVPEHHTHDTAPHDYGERSALARRPEESLLVTVPLILVLGVIVVDLVASTAARGQERALLLLRAALAKFHRQQVSFKRKHATEQLSTL